MADELREILPQNRELKIRQKTYKASPLTLNDWAELEEWAKGRIAARAVKAAKAAGIEGSALGDIAAQQPKQQDIQAELNCAAAAAHLLYLGLRKNHPEVTAEKAGDLVRLNEVDMDGLTNFLTGNLSDGAEKKTQAAVSG